MKLRPLVSLAITLFLTSSTRAQDQFDSICSRVLRALRASDWQAFRSECADPIVFERVERLYLQEIPPNLAKSLADTPGWINDGGDDSHNGNSTQPRDSNDRDIVITHLVAIKRDLTPDERRAFTKFCSYVREAWYVHQDRNLQGMETKSLIGPAIEGKVASNFKWLVQLELIDGSWRVRKLITDGH